MRARVHAGSVEADTRGGNGAISRFWGGSGARTNSRRRCGASLSAPCACARVCVCVRACVRVIYGGQRPLPLGVLGAYARKREGGQRVRVG